MVKLTSSLFVLCFIHCLYIYLHIIIYFALISTVAINFALLMLGHNNPMILCPFWHNDILCWSCMSCVYCYVSINYSILLSSIL